MVATSKSLLSFTDIQSTRALIKSKDGFIIDCDGVIYHGDKLLPGALEFTTHLRESGKRYLFLTNSSDKSTQQLVEKFARLGIKTEAEHFYTSSMATATFLSKQKPSGRVFVIGQSSLKETLVAQGMLVVGEEKAEMSCPDFSVVGECPELYTFANLEFAIKLVRRGARLIGTNEDVADRLGNELQPGVGALILPIAATSGYQPYFVGKPNPLMVRSALDRLGIRRDKAVVIGDRMNTDIKAGVEADVDTVSS